MIKFNTIGWNPNRDRPAPYDVMPYFYEELKNELKRNKLKKKDITKEWLKYFIIRKSRYMYWSRTQYEIIIRDWPCQKYEHKIDIHQQIMMNIDMITELMYNDIKGK